MYCEKNGQQTLGNMRSVYEQQLKLLFLMENINILIPYRIILNI